ncbi:conserved hypothetical protein [Verticillium alfalfae VaMs.102]|uniref:SPX domain-containing protein n=1 Tax=Verticillium alfalfae (strain VaMs.102 / ATCC MYA-4576 / FGSC 10136) TaxID=526221 RepID=C9S693_VERA1|nr:conserved hypothetical protein [Verticillium alfalfae VaMs.102]EEY14405.1 conserved hypothetical protein [Verticillium alfalfae VaMs.102]
MKYGDRLEQQSVPEWSLHNIDYNALKHEIKVNTRRDQAAAVAIPGHVDSNLHRFEERLFGELRSQHDRVDLFVNSKADEILRRLESISVQINRLIARCDLEGAAGISLKRQRKFSRYERDLLRCEEDILALPRFINAQVTAFRKILKKYKKWSGSPTLSVRFREEVLSHPKSFTRRDLTYLQSRYEQIQHHLRTATPQLSEPSSPSTDATSPSPSRPAKTTAQRFDPLPPPQTHYWNEYDYGSDAEGNDQAGEYAIYIDPNANASFPGLDAMRSIIRRPLALATSWFSRGHADTDASRQSLLSPGGNRIGPGYGGISPFGTETDEDIEYASSEENFPAAGYAGYYAALPSIADQQLERYREATLGWATIGAFAASFVLLAVASILIVTGRHKLRAEVDAGVTVGSVTSLFCACLGIGMMLYRRDKLSVAYRAAVLTSFLAACALNGMLLILVVDN